jgi:hypothetical protein
MMIICVPDIDTYIHVSSLDQCLFAFLALFPLSYLSVCFSRFPSEPCYYPIPLLDLAGIFLSLCLNWLSEIQCWADLVPILSFFFSYLTCLRCQMITRAYAS